jgi:nucleotide-binding universal stress UspA family protein
MTAQQAQRVVVGVDGSIIAVRALDRAAEEAALRGATLEIVYAVPDLDEAGPVLASALSRVRDRYPGLTVSTAPVAGDAARALVSRSRNAALTVVGTRGLGGFAGLLLGSVSLRLAAHAHGPLLVVRGEPNPNPGVVLLGIESDADTDAAAYAFEEAARRGAPLRILHAWTYRHRTPAGLSPTPPDRVQDDIARHAKAEEALPGQVMAPLREKHPHVAVETRTVRSGPAHALLQATLGADVVVIAAHRRHGGPSPQLGPVAHALLHHASCPVVVVPVPAV